MVFVWLEVIEPHLRILEPIFLIKTYLRHSLVRKKLKWKWELSLVKIWDFEAAAISVRVYRQSFFQLHSTFQFPVFSISFNNLIKSLHSRNPLISNRFFKKKLRVQIRPGPYFQENQHQQDRRNQRRKSTIHRLHSRSWVFQMFLK